MWVHVVPSASYNVTRLLYTASDFAHVLQYCSKYISSHTGYTKFVRNGTGDKHKCKRDVDIVQ